MTHDGLVKLKINLDNEDFFVKTTNCNKNNEFFDEKMCKLKWWSSEENYFRIYLLIDGITQHSQTEVYSKVCIFYLKWSSKCVSLPFNGVLR